MTTFESRPNTGEICLDEVLWAHAAMSRGPHLFSSGRISDGLGLMHRAWQTADRLNDPVVFFAAFLGSAFANWVSPTRLSRPAPLRSRMPTW